MSSYVWTPRNMEYRKGYVLCPLELMNEYYDWEADPMCDCTPARLFRDSTGKWNLRVFRTYAYTEDYPTGGHRNVVATCHEPWAETGKISDGIYKDLLNKLLTENIPLKDLKELFEDARLNSEAIELMP